MLIFYLKALHIVGFVAWFAGLFYLVRLFVYHVEAEAKPEPDRKILTEHLNIMEWRVYKIIVNPAMMATFTFGISMLVYNPAYLKMGWLHAKLLLLVLLVGYQLFAKRIIKNFEEGKNQYTSFQFRMLNEVPTLFLVSIVFLAVLRNQVNYFYLLLTVIGLGILFYFITKAYKRVREGKSLN